METECETTIRKKMAHRCESDCMDVERNKISALRGQIEYYKRRIEEDKNSLVRPKDDPEKELSTAKSNLATALSLSFRIRVATCMENSPRCEGSPDYPKTYRRDVLKCEQNSD